MFDSKALIENLHKFGVGRRRVEDELFGGDSGEGGEGGARRPARLACYDDEAWGQLHVEAAGTAGGAGYRCGHCRRELPAPHLLDLHVQETHDSFFAALAARRPAYCCYIQECPDKFVNAEKRLEHCVKVHKLPKDFRFEIKPKGVAKQECKPMEMDVAPSVTSPPSAPPGPPGAHGAHTQKFFFHNSKQKGLTKYSGKTFTCDKSDESTHTPNMDQIMSDLKQNLPK